MIGTLKILLTAISTLSILMAGCAPVATSAPSDSAAAPAAAEPAAAEPNEVRVFLAQPADGAAVSSPVKLVMTAENFVVEPANDAAVDGHGHLHIMVDTDCIEPGLGIPKDETHLHFGQGQLEAELELAAGEHTLCLQAADGFHVALDGAGMTNTISIVVE